MITFEYSGKRFDFLFSTDYKDLSLGFGIGYSGLYLDLAIVRFNFRFQKDEDAEGWV